MLTSLTVTLVLSYLNNNIVAKLVDSNHSTTTHVNQNKINSSIQGCFFGGYDFSFLNQNNGSDYTGTNVGIITNTYKMNICGPGNPHILGHVTLIGSFGSDGAGVAWNFIDPQKPELGVTLQSADKTEKNMRVFVNTTSCIAYLYLNIKCSN
ncbi:unnamed protein product [Adineta steineri]|uniref:Uncharacterized protein n=1 Tax=Adineta steineri TaxID=433720 RepID=A0A814AAG4_9BILA|nr:unnamed protein product [Adineta steineri]CAF4032253.1 unnamed protein product [Adineta steineri]